MNNMNKETYNTFRELRRMMRQKKQKLRANLAAILQNEKRLMVEKDETKREKLKREIEWYRSEVELDQNYLDEYKKIEQKILFVLHSCA